MRGDGVPYRETILPQKKVLVNRLPRIVGVRAALSKGAPESVE